MTVMMVFFIQVHFDIHCSRIRLTKIDGAPKLVIYPSISGSPLNLRRPSVPTFHGINTNFLGYDSGVPSE